MALASSAKISHMVWSEASVWFVWYAMCSVSGLFHEGGYRSQWGAMDRHISKWQCSSTALALYDIGNRYTMWCLDTNCFYNPDSAARLWGTLDGLLTLRRPLNIKLLKNYLARTSVGMFRNTVLDLCRVLLGPWYHTVYLHISTLNLFCCRNNKADKLVKKSKSRATGSVQVTGQKKGLQRSGEYPLAFGLAVSALIHPSRAAPSSKPERCVCDLCICLIYLYHMKRKSWVKPCRTLILGMVTPTIPMMVQLMTWSRAASTHHGDLCRSYNWCSSIDNIYSKYTGKNPF